MIFPSAPPRGTHASEGKNYYLSAPGQVCVTDFCGILMHTPAGRSEGVMARLARAKVSIGRQKVLRIGVPAVADGLQWRLRGVSHRSAHHLDQVVTAVEALRDGGPRPSDQSRRSAPAASRTVLYPAHPHDPREP